MARCFGLATNLAKENEPEENPKDFPSKHKLKQCGIHVVVLSCLSPPFYL